MAYSREQKEYHKEKIALVMTISGRGAINYGTDVSLRYIQEQLEQNGLHLPLNYIGTLKKKILVDRTVNIERRIRRITKQDLARLLSINLTRAYEMMLSKKSTNFEVLGAMREIRETYMAIYDKETTLSQFSDGLKSMPVINQQYVISDDKRFAIVDAMVRFGILPKQNDAESTAKTGGDSGSAEPRSETAEGSGKQ